ncbi:unnamed protein product [Calicophoron daubneyi]
MVHAIPDLHVSETVAAELALQDEQGLLASRKLVLLVDLDQTIIHTTNDPQAFKYKDIYRYRLPGSPLVYHTSFRPHLLEMLDRLSNYYQMHICTFGNRVYAHQLAGMIDPKRRFFSQRILSRDECFNPVTKSANLKALFPRGLNLVCIVDDRAEVWDWSPNLIHIKPYRFFPDTGDINSFPWLSSNSPEISTEPASSDSAGAETPLPDSQLPKKAEDCTSEPENKPSLQAGCSHGPNDCQPVAKVEVNGELVANSEVTADLIVGSSQEPKDAPNRADKAATSEVPDQSATQFPESDEKLKPPSQNTEPEKLLNAADGDYLLRLQEILISLHRSYFQMYDRWLAQQTTQSPSQQSDSDRTSDSSSICSSSRPSKPNPPDDHLSTDSACCLPHIADVIAQHRSEVLGPSCHITLSGLAPSHIPADRCLAGRIVRSLGAVLHAGLRLPTLPGAQLTSITRSDQVTINANQSLTDKLMLPMRPPAHTTHLVACRRGTEKVNAALEFLKKCSGSSAVPPINLVSPHWLWACHYHWRHLSESDFPLIQDFHPSDFDPEAEPAPGTMRYARRYVRHHHHHPGPHLLSHGERHRSAKVVRDRHVYRHHHHSQEQTPNRRHHKRNHHTGSRRPVDSPHSQSHPINGLASASDPVSFETDHTVPQLDIDMVQSALASIRAEEENDRERERLRRHERRRKHHYAKDMASPHKRHRPDTHGTVEYTSALLPEDSAVEVATVTGLNTVQPAVDTSGVRSEKGDEHESSSSSPSLDSSDSELETTAGKFQLPNSPGTPNGVVDKSRNAQSLLSPSLQPAMSQITGPDNHSGTQSDTKSELTEHLLTDSDSLRAESATADETVEQKIIKDKGEADFDDNAIADLTEDNTEEGSDAQAEEDIQAQLRAFLPPPKPLILADNPLMHLPPQATSQMLAEIEDAVMEEETQKATSVPVEAELYDPARIGLGDSSSDSDSSTPKHETSPANTPAGDILNYEKRIHKRRNMSSTSLNSVRSVPVDPLEVERRNCHLQVQRELLLRRRRRAGPEDALKIEKRIRRIDAYLHREERRRRSADDLAFITHSQHGTRAQVNLSVIPDSESEDEDMWDTDYPKGWSPEERARDERRQRSAYYHVHHDRRSLCMSPAIHSDPETTGDWWRTVDENDDCKEWNVFPEGYDYADAEHTRNLLLNRDSAHGRPHGDFNHRSITECLFGTEDDESEDSGAEEDDDDDGSSEVADPDEGEEDEYLEDLADECWDPLREYM